MSRNAGRLRQADTNASWVTSWASASLPRIARAVRSVASSRAGLAAERDVVAAPGARDERILAASGTSIVPTNSLRAIARSVVHHTHLTMTRQGFGSLEIMAVSVTLRHGAPRTIGSTLRPVEAAEHRPRRDPRRARGRALVGDVRPRARPAGPDRRLRPRRGGLRHRVDGAVVGYIQAVEETEPDFRHAGIDLFLATDAQGRGLGPRPSAHWPCTSSTIAATTASRSTRRPTTNPLSAPTRRSVSGRSASCARYQRMTDGRWVDALLMDLLADELVRSRPPTARRGLVRRERSLGWGRPEGGGRYRPEFHEGGTRQMTDPTPADPTPPPAAPAPSPPPAAAPAPASTTWSPPAAPRLGGSPDRDHHPGSPCSPRRLSASLVDSVACSLRELAAGGAVTVLVGWLRSPMGPPRLLRLSARGP